MAEDKNAGAGAEGATPEQIIADLQLKLKAEIEKSGQLTNDLKAEKEKSAKLEKEVAAGQKIIAKQAEDLEVKEIQESSKKPIVMIDKTPYRFLGQGTLIVDGVTMDAKDLVKDAEKCKALIKAGSGMFVEHKKSKK